MVSVNIQNKHEFNIIGAKVWISGTENQQFADFWKKCHTNGVIEQLSKFQIKNEKSVTNSTIIGLSSTEINPAIRKFYFYIAVETKEKNDQEIFEVKKIKPYKWAIFSSKGNDIDSLMKCEMYAWKEWLPNNGIYIHDNGPELEVYFQENKIEYWIPVRKM